MSCGVCVECNRLRAAERRKSHPEQCRAAVVSAHAKYKDRYKQAHLVASNRWRAANPEAMKAIRRRGAEKKGLAAVRAYGRAAKAKRRATERRQMPAWADEKAIRSVYAGCPEGYHVDHIVPLRGRSVSGLHVEYNLQYLTASENLRKHNNFVT